MKLYINGTQVNISDDSNEARKISQGYDYSFDGKKIVIGSTKKYYDVAEFEGKVKKNEETKEDIHEFLKGLIKIYKQVKYNIYE